MKQITLQLLPTACFTKFGKDYYAMINKEQFIEYFFDNYNIEIVSNIKKETDIFVTSVYSTNMDDILYKNSKVHIMICIENLSNTRFRHYTHFNTFGEYGDNRVHIYVYNHIDKIQETSSYIAIPCVYFRLDYLQKKYSYYYNYPTLQTSFSNKKFCLMINKSNINPLINEFVKKLETIDKVDNIALYNNKILKKSCFNSIELLEVFNKYKFILCVENSYCNGYVTEKICNVFFSKSIPIYSGSPIIESYCNKNSFVHIENKNIDKSINIIQKLYIDESLYNTYINAPKIAKEYNNENYKEKMKEIIEKICV